jgi:hypothetical protein
VPVRLDEPSGGVPTGKRQLAALEAQVASKMPAVTREALLEPPRPCHCFLKEGWAGDVRNAAVSISREVLAN